jgi:hypothetical protein
MIVVGTTPQPSPADLALAAALTRFLASSSAPAYLRTAGTAWLAAHTSRQERTP